MAEALVQSTMERRVGRLHVRESGQGMPLILVHGGSGSWTHWVRNIEPLAAHFRVLAVDLPGYGQSPRPPRGIRPDQYVENILSLLDGLVDGEPSVAVCGFSFGATISALFAAHLGPRCAALCLLGPAGFGPVDERGVTLRHLDRTAPLARQREIVAHNLGIWMLTSTPAPDDAVVDIQLANIKGTHYDSRPISHSHVLLETLPQVSAPVLAAWGSKDPLAFPDVAHRAAALLEHRPDARIEIVEGAGHWVQFEAPESVAALVTDFVKGARVQ